MLLCKSKDNDGFAHGELTANTETDPLEISLHMQESAAKATSLEALNNALKTGQKNIVFDFNLTCILRNEVTKIGILRPCFDIKHVFKMFHGAIIKEKHSYDIHFSCKIVLSRRIPR